MAAVYPFDMAALRQRCTPADVLICDSCGGDLTDTESIQRAMIFWNPEQSGTLVLAHKGRCDPRGTRHYSAELAWFGRPMSALRRISQLVIHYNFTEPEMARLTLIAWAIAEVTTGAQEPLDPIDTLAI